MLVVAPRLLASLLACSIGLVVLVLFPCLLVCSFVSNVAETKLNTPDFSLSLFTPNIHVRPVLNNTGVKTEVCCISIICKLMHGYRASSSKGPDECEQVLLNTKYHRCHRHHPHVKLLLAQLCCLHFAFASHLLQHVCILSLSCPCFGQSSEPTEYALVRVL